VTKERRGEAMAGAAATRSSSSISRPPRHRSGRQRPSDVFLYDIDDLNGVAKQTSKSACGEAERC